jgi:hypothetical protein
MQAMWNTSTGAPTMAEMDSMTQKAIKAPLTASAV